MAVNMEMHGKGIGNLLWQTVENDLHNQNIKFLTVKTLSESRPNCEYEQTRKFF